MGAQLSRCTSCTTSPAPAVVTAEPVNDVGWWSCCSARPRKPEVRLDNRPERSYGPEAALVVKFRLYREAGDQTGAASLCAEDVVFRVPGKELVGLEAASKEVLSKPATALESEQPLVTTVAKPGEEWIVYRAGKAKIGAELVSFTHEFRIKKVKGQLRIASVILTV